MRPHANSTARLALPLALVAIAVSGRAGIGNSSGVLESQNTPVEMPDVQKLGPLVGANVPDFSLADQTGHVQTLGSIMGPRGAILVFFRSADW